MLGLRPPVANLQLTISILLVIAQTQDIVFLSVFGSENMAQVIVGALYIFEIVIAVVVVSLIVGTDKIISVAAYHSEQEDTTWKEKFILILRPYILHPFVTSSDPPIPIRKHRKNKNELAAAWEMSEAEQQLANAGNLEQRSVWRTVLLDLFSNRVRSKPLTVIVIAIWMNQCLFMFPRMIGLVEEHFSPDVQGLFLSIGQMVVAFIIWFLCGVTLIGNNVFWSRWWLCLAAAKLSYTTTMCYVRFLGTTSVSGFEELTRLWMQLFLGIAGVIGLCICGKLLFTDRREMNFYQSEERAQQYTSDMMDCVPPNVDPKEHCSHNRKIYRNPDDFPQLLLVGSFASVPVILAVSFITMYVGVEALRHARIAQVYARGMHGDISRDEAIESLDYDYNREISPNEAGLSTLLHMVGSPELSNVAGEIWQKADTDDNGDLNEEEIFSFMDRMRATKAAIQCWAQGDPLLAGELLLSSLDRDHSGTLNSTEFSDEDMERVVQVSAPGQEVLLGTDLQEVRTASDADQDGALSMPEIGAYFTAVKERATEFRNIVQVAVVSLMRMVSQGVAHLWKQGLSVANWTTSFVAKDAKEKQELRVSAERIADNMIAVLSQSAKSAGQMLAALLASLHALGQRIPADVEEQWSKMPDLPVPSAWSLEGSVPAIPKLPSLNDALYAPSPAGAPAPIEAIPASPLPSPAAAPVPSSPTQYQTEAGAAPLKSFGNGDTAAKENQTSRPYGSLNPFGNGTVILTKQNQTSLTSGSLDPFGSGKPMVLLTKEIPKLEEESEAAKQWVTEQREAGDQWATAAEDGKPKVKSEVDSAAASAQSGTEYAVQQGNVWLTKLADLIEELLPKLRDMVTRAFAFLEALKDQAVEAPEQAAHDLLVRLDNNTDGRLDDEELGIRGALAMIHPDLAPRAQELMMLVDNSLAHKGNSGGDVADGALTEEELAELLRYTGALLLDYFGDLDGDGEATQEDLKILVQAAIERTFAAPEEESTLAAAAPAPAPASLLKSRGTLDRRAMPVSLIQSTSTLRRAMAISVFPLRKAPQALNLGLLQQRRNEPGYFDSLTSKLPDTSGWFDFNLNFDTSSMFDGAVSWMVHYDLNRMEAFLYISALVAFSFGIFVIVRPFFGFRRIFENMQSGKTMRFKGNTQIAEFEKRADFPTFFPGIVFSTVLSGMAVIFILVFLILNIITSADFYRFIWSLRKMLVWLGATVIIQLVIMRRLVLDYLCIKDGDIVRPRLFACVYAMFVIINFALGALASIARILCMLPFVFIQIHTLDDTVLREEFVGFDIGYTSFLTLTRMDYRLANPVHRSFIADIAPQASRRYGPKPSEKSRFEHQEAKRKTIRNKFWLALTLNRNPGLQALRKRPGEEEPTQP